MTIISNESELKNFKSREMVPLKCQKCESIFFKTKNSILFNVKRCGFINKFCSDKCKGEAHKNQEIVYCLQCKTPILKQKCVVRKNNFCNHSCHAKYLNSHKKFGCRRSKLEQWIEEQLTELYPKLKIHYNEIDTINAELDIYIPSLKLAFELNGIFHYEPIYKNFQNTKNNDQRKFQACLEKEIELCIIDTYNVKYIKKERDKKFLDIITNIINNKIGATTDSAHEAELLASLRGINWPAQVAFALSVA